MEGDLAPGRIHRQRVLPDGCMDVLFELGEPTRPAEGSAHGLSTYVVGAMPTAQVFAMGGRVRLVAARFRPGGAAALLGFPAREATGTVVDLEAVWGGFARELRQRLGEAVGPEERARVLARALAAVGRDALPPDPALAAASAAMRETAGRVSIAGLATGLGLSTRTLERRFAEDVGLTPKQAARVARLRRALDLLGRSPPLPLARVAPAAGYHDQPHLTREFGALAGLTPAAWRREREPRASS